MKNYISLIYGDQVLDDLAFCRKHEKRISRYAHGIMTLQYSPIKTLEAVAKNPILVAGWTDLLREHPNDLVVLRSFLSRLIQHYYEASRLSDAVFRSKTSS